MKKFKGLLLIILSTITIFPSSSLFADSRANSLVFTMGGGYEFFASKRLLNNTGVGYLEMGYNFTRHLGIEALIGFFSTSFIPEANYNKNPNGNLYLVNGVYHFNAYRHFLEPFMLAGVGVTGISPNRFDANNEGNINAGIGFNLFFDKLVALRFEARDLYTMVGGKNDIFLNAAISFFVDLC